VAISEQEVWSVARLYVDRFGAEARAKADDHAYDLREDGDAADLAAWLRIIEAIGEIQRRQSSGAVVNLSA
jgi:hypothetical protein